MPGETEPAAGVGEAGTPVSGQQPYDTSVAHSARVHDYWLGGKDNFAADRAAGDAVIAAYPGIVMSVRANRAFLARVVPVGSYLALSQVASDIEPERMAEAAKRYNRLAHETQRHRTHAEVTRFFDGLDLVEPGVVAVQKWRPASEVEAQARSAMWGGLGRKR